MAYELHFKGTVYPLRVGSVTVPGYAALWALCANLAVAGLLSAILPRLGIKRGTDATSEEDYEGATG
jgi:SSS family solute:Na+ symporter